MRNTLLQSLLLILVVTLGMASPAAAQPANAVYIAGTWNDDAIHYLDFNLNDLGSFAAGATDPNGTGTDNSTIWSGHFTSDEVVAHNLAGTELYRWTTPELDGFQGMEYIPELGALAVYTTSRGIDLRNPITGVSSVNYAGQSANFIEGLAWDGTYLWQMGGSIISATNIADGSLVFTIPNPALGGAFNGTGLASRVPGELTVAEAGGDWWRINSADGAILASGTTFGGIYGLSPITVPEPSSLCLFGMAALALPRLMRRRVSRAKR